VVLPHRPKTVLNFTGRVWSWTRTLPLKDYYSIFAGKKYFSRQGISRILPLNVPDFFLQHSDGHFWNFKLGIVSGNETEVLLFFVAISGKVQLFTVITGYCPRQCWISKFLNGLGPRFPLGKFLAPPPSPHSRLGGVGGGSGRNPLPPPTWSVAYNLKAGTAVWERLAGWEPVLVQTAPRIYTFGQFIHNLGFSSCWYLGGQQNQSIVHLKTAAFIQGFHVRHSSYFTIIIKSSLCS
jgi:hypothetical protein